MSVVGMGGGSSLDATSVVLHSQAAGGVKGKEEEERLQPAEQQPMGVTDINVVEGRSNSSRLNPERVMTINPKQLALYIVYPETIPGNERDQYEKLSEYLLFINTIQETQKVVEDTAWHVVHFSQKKNIKIHEILNHVVLEQDARDILK